MDETWLFKMKNNFRIMIFLRYLCSILFIFFNLTNVFAYNDYPLNMSQSNIEISSKSDNEICEMIDIDVSPLITVEHEEEAKKRNLNCNIKSAISNKSLQVKAFKQPEKENRTVTSNSNQKFLEEQRKRRELERKLTLLEKEKRTLNTI